MESRVIKGWRAREEEELEKARSAVWAARAVTVYTEDTRVFSEQLDGSRRMVSHSGWFRRVFDESREEAKEALRQLKAARARRRYAQRTSDQVEADRQWWRAWRESKPEQWHRDQAARQKAWRAANPEKAKAKDKRDRHVNAEAKKASQKRWREANAAKVKEYEKRYREENADMRRAAVKAWEEANRDYRLEYHREQNKRRR